MLSRRETSEKGEDSGGGEKNFLKKAESQIYNDIKGLYLGIWFL